ncbi:MAG: type II secretion system protein [Vampirovibrio sp.]
MKSCNKNLKKRGFTLAELLVSVGVLGLISALTLPQLYISQEKIKKKAAFKEAFNTLSNAYHIASLNGDTGWLDSPLKYMNGSKVCDTHSYNQGCVSDVVADTSGERAHPGVVLASGLGSVDI